MARAPWPLLGTIILPWGGDVLGGRIGLNIRPDILLLGILALVSLLNILALLARFSPRLRNWLGRSRRARRRDLLEQLVESLAVVLNQETLRTLLVERLTAILELSCSALFLRGAREQLLLVESLGTAVGADGEVLLPEDGALAKTLATRNEPTATALLREALTGAVLTGVEQDLLGRREFRLWLPLVADSALQGVLIVGPKRNGRPLTPQERYVLRILAHQAGITAQAARLVAEVRERREELARANQKLLLAGEAERRRLARRLHDRAVQQLIGISYQLAQLGRSVDQGKPPNSGALQAMRQEVLSVVEDLRHHIGELRPAGLEELGLAAALRGYVAHQQREHNSHGPHIEVQAPEDEAALALPPMMALALFRVAQEALRNAVKHADASRVSVRLEIADGRAALIVSDDGRGFRVPERLSEFANEEHYGLVSVAERVAQIGGELTIDSAPGQGTTLRVTASIVGSEVVGA